MRQVRDVAHEKAADAFPVKDCLQQHDHRLFIRIPALGQHFPQKFVMDGEKLVGIITERHYSRNVILKGKKSPTTVVSDIMERDVIHVRPEQSVELCMALMTEKRVRHLPVLEGQKVVGIISIGDLLKSIISKQKFVIDELEHYIHG